MKRAIDLLRGMVRGAAGCLLGGALMVPMGGSVIGPMGPTSSASLAVKLANATREAQAVTLTVRGKKPVSLTLEADGVMLVR